MSNASRTNLAEEYGSQYLHGLNPFGAVSNVAGFFKALKDPPQSNAAKSGKDNLAPSVGAYRTVSRLKSQAYEQDRKYKGHATHNYLAELLGGMFTSGTIPTVGGAAIGAYLTRGALMDKSLPVKDRLMGALKGAGVGIGVTTVANLLGLIGSTITDRRTEMEQVEHDKRRHVEDWLIPGFGFYNKGKRLGRSEGDYDEHPELHDKMKKEIEDEKPTSKASKWLKALALVAGTGMTAYGLYKLPSYLKGRADTAGKLLSGNMEIPRLGGKNE